MKILGILVILFCLFCLFYKQIFDLYFFIWSKIYDKKHKLSKATRIWASKGIVNNMWTDENRPMYFTEESIIEYNDKVKELDLVLQNIESEKHKMNNDITKWEKEATGLPTGYVFDPLDLHQTNQDNYVKLKARSEKFVVNIETSILDIQAKFAKISLLYKLMDSIKTEVKTPEFIEKARIAVEEDISFVESIGIDKLNEMDKLGFSFVSILLKGIDIEELNNFKERYTKLNEAKKNSKAISEA